MKSLVKYALPTKPPKPTNPKPVTTLVVGEEAGSPR